MKMRKWGRSMGRKQIESALYEHLQKQPTVIKKWPEFNEHKTGTYYKGAEPREEIVVNPKWFEFVPCYDATQDFVTTGESKFVQWNEPIHE